VIKKGMCALSLDSTDLAADRSGMHNIQPEIPHWTKSGHFTTGNLLTRIESVNTGVLVQGTLYGPVISGENATVEVTMKNENDTVTDTYNLTLYSGTARLKDWVGRTLGPDENETLSYTITSPGLGTQTIKANATISHGSMFTDEVSKNFTVIGTPALVIDGPDTASGGDTVTFNADTSSHTDTGSHIKNFRWTFWAPDETEPRDNINNATSAEFTLPSEVKVGNWTVMLVVTDSNGITPQPALGTTLKPDSELLRPATESYRELKVFQVGKAQPPSFFTLENIVLIVILVVIIALAVVYLRRRSR
jgi:hypothetical protein